MPNIVVVGAGVAGLTTALLLSKDPKYSITIAAKHMPGDYDIAYTSPWAGADYLPFAGPEDSIWEKNTWPELSRLATEVPEAGIHFRTLKILNRTKDVATARGARLRNENPWYKDFMPDFRVLPKEDLPPGIESGTSLTSLCINTAIYLPWLVGQCLRNGVILKRAVLQHISEAAALHSSGGKTDITINCTGLQASKIGGVLDTTVIPVRGQIVVVRNDPGVMMTLSGTDDGDDEVCYIMTRAGGGGTILGGTTTKGSWESQPDPNVAIRIMKRAVDLCPQLTGGKGVEGLSVVRHGVGLRPFRLDGVRIETEKIGDGWVVHNYGHAGWGYQGSYGCSYRAVELVDEVFSRKSKP